MYCTLYNTEGKTYLNIVRITICIFIRFLLFWHIVSLFLYYPINIINVGYKKTTKKGGKANVSATYEGPLQCHKLKEIII